MVGEQDGDLSEQSSVDELKSVARILEDTDSVHAKTLRESEDDSVEVVLRSWISSTTAMWLGVNLVVRVDGQVSYLNSPGWCILLGVPGQATSLIAWTNDPSICSAAYSNTVVDQTNQTSVWEGQWVTKE
jgi:hypothetical protein